MGSCISYASNICLREASHLSFVTAAFQIDLALKCNGFGGIVAFVMLHMVIFDFWRRHLSNRVTKTTTSAAHKDRRYLTTESQSASRDCC
jgi:hypothetical protein